MQAFFFSRDTLELVQRVELPGAPSIYHFVNAFQEGGSGGRAVVVVAKHRDGDAREKAEATFRDLYSGRCRTVLVPLFCERKCSACMRAKCARWICAIWRQRGETTAHLFVTYLVGRTGGEAQFCARERGLYFCPSFDSRLIVSVGRGDAASQSQQFLSSGYQLLRSIYSSKLPRVI